jgi:hypothetical protein
MAKPVLAFLFAASFRTTSAQRPGDERAGARLARRAACQQVPNGYDWLDFSSGGWGYAGNPAPQGHISDGCRQARRPSLSERGMLYSTHDWVR